MRDIAKYSPEKASMLGKIATQLLSNREPNRRDVMHTLHSALRLAGNTEAANPARAYYHQLKEENKSLYNSHLLAEGDNSITKIEAVKAVYEPNAPQINGYEILNKYFDQVSNPGVLALAKIGFIGDGIRIC
jgi:hypothetical protein